jgi:hypothetical protein
MTRAKDRAEIALEGRDAGIIRQKLRAFGQALRSGIRGMR